MQLIRVILAPVFLGVKGPLEIVQSSGGHNSLNSHQILTKLQVIIPYMQVLVNKLVFHLEL